MMNTDADTIEFLQSLKRPETMLIKEYGKYSERTREAVYDGREQNYSVRKSFTETGLKVHSSRSLIEYIKSELNRRGKETGKNSTLKIGISGGTFCADDDFSEGICEYTRVLSQQWNVLAGINGRIMNHEEFLMALLKLSPSIQDFHKKYKAFLKVRIIGKSTMTSNPVFVEGEAESGYMVKYKLETGQSAEDQVPDGFKVQVPYVKASDKKYDIDVDVQIMNGSNNQLQIKVNIPLLEKVEEDAILDEIKSIKEQISKYSDMLVLSDI